jgi:hypothetical protein
METIKCSNKNLKQLVIDLNFKKTEDFQKANTYNWNEYTKKTNLEMPPMLHLKDDNNQFIDKRFLYIKNCTYITEDSDCKNIKGNVIKNNKMTKDKCDTTCGTSTKSMMCKYYDCCLKNEKEEFCEKCGKVESSTFAFNIIEIMRQIVVTKCVNKKNKVKMPIIIFNPITQEPFNIDELEEIKQQFNKEISGLVQAFEDSKKTTFTKIRETITTANVGWALFLTGLVLSNMGMGDSAGMVNMIANINMFSNLAFSFDNFYTMGKIIKDKKLNANMMDSLRIITYESLVHLGDKIPGLDAIDKTVMGINIINNIKKQLKGKDNFGTTFNKEIYTKILQQQKKIKGQLKLINKNLVEKDYIKKISCSK